MELMLPFSYGDAQNWSGYERWENIKARFALHSRQGHQAQCTSDSDLPRQSSSVFKHILDESGQLPEKINNVVLTFGSQEFESILAEIENLCVPSFLLLYERHRFFTRCQRDGESAHSFIAHLLYLADSCGFQNDKEKYRYLLSGITDGVKDEELRQKLLKVDSSDLHKKVATCLHCASQEYGYCPGSSLGLRIQLLVQGEERFVDTIDGSDIADVPTSESIRGTPVRDVNVTSDPALQDRGSGNTRAKRTVESKADSFTQCQRPRRNAKKVARLGISNVSESEQRLTLTTSVSGKISNNEESQARAVGDQNDMSDTGRELGRQQIKSQHEEGIHSRHSLCEDDGEFLSGRNEQNVTSSCAEESTEKHGQERSEVVSGNRQKTEVSLATEHHFQSTKVSRRTAKHKCSVCTASYATRNLLKCHMRSHTGGKKIYKCETCGIDFGSVSSRTKHIHQQHPETLTHKCSDCGRAFETLKTLVKHRREHSSVVTCEDCGKTFGSGRLYEQHRRRKHPATRYPCNICGLQFPYPSKLKLHLMSKHNATKPFMCEICGASFAEKSILVNHKHTHTGMKRHECTTCGRRFLLKTTLNNHMHTHLDHKPHVCEVCGVSFKLAYYLRNHMKTHAQDRERPHACPTCGAAFLKLYQLRNHERKHTGEKPYKCNVCGLTFSQTSSMKKHVKRIHEGVKPTNSFFCEFCGLSFSHSCRLKLHLMKHTGERPFVCSHCGASYRENHQLRKHMKIHSGQEPYKCPICGQKFLQKSHMEGHVRNHTGEKPFSCQVCDARFSLKGYLRDHLKTHDSNRERRYKCNVCGKGFTTSSHMRSHERLHSGEKPHKCHVCHARFTKHSSVVKHLRRAHGIHNPPALTKVLHHQSLQQQQEAQQEVEQQQTTALPCLSLPNPGPPRPCTDTQTHHQQLFQLSDKSSQSLTLGHQDLQHTELQPFTSDLQDHLPPTLTQIMDHQLQQLQLPAQVQNPLQLERTPADVDQRHILHSEVNPQMEQAAYTLAS